MRKLKSSISSKGQQTEERGVALVIALLAMTVLTAIGFALMLSSSTETLIHSNFRRSGLAFYAARAGLEEARGRLGPDADAPPVSICATVPAPGCPATTPDTHIADVTTAVYIIRLAGIDPTLSTCSYLGVSCDELTYDPTTPHPTAKNLLLTTQPGTLMPYVWVKIALATQRKLRRNLVTPCNPTDPADPSYCNPTTLDDSIRICWDEKNLVLAPVANPTCALPLSPAFILTSLAIQTGGGTRFLREVVATGRVPSIPGPLTLNYNPAGFNPPTSHPFVLNGCDAATAPTCTAPQSKPALLLPLIADRDNAQTLITDGVKCSPVGSPMGGCQPGANHNPDYQGVDNNGCSPPCTANNSADMMAAETMTPNPLTSNPFFADCAGVQSMQAYVTQGADHIYNGNQTTIPFPGSTSNPVINVFNGDLNVSASDFCTTPSDCGAGIVMVTGNLTVVGTPTYNGIILVLGGSMTINGGGNGTITGGIFIANTTTCPATLGPTAYSNPGGGTLTIQYDSRWANPQKGYLPMQILSLNY